MATDFPTRLRNGVADFLLQQASALTLEPKMKKVLRRLSSETGREEFFERQAEALRRRQRPPAKAPSPPQTEQERFFAHLRKNATCSEDLFATRAAADWLDDERFQEAYLAGQSISVWGSSIRWRVYTLLKCAAKASRLSGNFVECGVDRGGTAMAVLTYLKPEAFANRTFYLFDTFEGVVKDQRNPVEHSTTRLRDERYPAVYETVKETFSPHGFVELVQGAVPSTLDGYGGGKVAYLHIDMNVALPECEAFRFFWPKLAKGAPVVFDDYGFPFHSEQRKALDDVAAELGTDIMMLPTGQGLCWK